MSRIFYGVFNFMYFLSIYQVIFAEIECFLVNISFKYYFLAFEGLSRSVDVVLVITRGIPNNILIVMTVIVNNWGNVRAMRWDYNFFAFFFFDNFDKLINTVSFLRKKIFYFRKSFFTRIYKWFKPLAIKNKIFKDFYAEYTNNCLKCQYIWKTVIERVIRRTL